jgi:hypothetical protein
MAKRGYSRINVSRIFDLGVEDDEKAIGNFMASTLCFFKGKVVEVRLEIKETGTDEEKEFVDKVKANVIKGLGLVK